MSFWEAKEGKKGEKDEEVRKEKGFALVYITGIVSDIVPMRWKVFKASSAPKKIQVWLQTWIERLPQGTHVLVVRVVTEELNSNLGSRPCSFPILAEFSD